MNTPLHLCPRLQHRHHLYIEEIILLEAMGNYTMVYLHDGRKILTSKTLKIFGKMMPSETFWRVNKTHLIRVQEIVAWHDLPKSAIRLILTNGFTCDVSRRRKTRIKFHLTHSFLNKQNV